MSEIPQNAMDILQAVEDTLNQPRYCYDLDSDEYHSTKQKSRRQQRRSRHLFRRTKTHTKPTHTNLTRSLFTPHSAEDDYDDDMCVEEPYNKDNDLEEDDATLPTSSASNDEELYLHDRSRRHRMSSYLTHPPADVARAQRPLPAASPSPRIHPVVAHYLDELARQVRGALQEIAHMGNELAAVKATQRRTRTGTPYPMPTSTQPL